MKNYDNKSLVPLDLITPFVPLELRPQSNHPKEF